MRDLHRELLALPLLAALTALAMPAAAPAVARAVESAAAAAEGEVGAGVDEQVEVEGLLAGGQGGGREVGAAGLDQCRDDTVLVHNPFEG